MRHGVFGKALGIGFVALGLAGLPELWRAETAEAQSAPKSAKTPRLFDELKIRNSSGDADAPADAAQAPAQAAAVPALVFPALQHAAQAGASECLGPFGQMLQRTIDAPHDAHSLWSVEAPALHAFVSIAGLRYANPIAPRGVVVASAGPNAVAGCDTMAVQILPSSRSCAAIQSGLGSGVKALGQIGDLPLLELADGSRIVLLPTAGNGCALVGVNVAFLK
jgi:hypothetical protein